ncbi:cell division protein SepF [Cuneatibacter sp. NSJ-177]|uniref:cell division protein SepF n=1 Tax=Cuneatibacter sp. NSJ-177 TaxID=2931401 RepID=UPI001FD4FFEC|nr:cell division protein SepF [Cuneatibacter sp. NSJ-177]MCJ7836445.1 cell division protein SepF [Cuneatibacter sp. NSJ-177]
MANIIDKFLNSMKLNDDEYDEEDDFDMEDDFEEEPAPSPRFGRKKTSKTAREDDDMDMPPMEREQKPLRVKRTSASNNVVPMRSRSNMEVCMVKPASIDDAREVCDILLSGRAVVINMEGVHVDLAQRIIDFTSGACYSMNGNLQKISNYIFIVTPSSIELSGDFQDVISGREAAAALSLDL